MKKLVALLAVLALVFAFFGCADSETQTEPSQTSTETSSTDASSTSNSTGTSTHINDTRDLHIPSLTVYCDKSDLNVQWRSGGWYEKMPDGKMSGINADSAHPKDILSYHPRLALPSFEGKTALLSLYPKPDKVEVTAYPIGKDGKVSDNAKTTSYILTDDFNIPLADNTLYDIIGVWNDPDRGGRVCYAFVTDSAFTVLADARKVLYDKYPALKNLDPSVLSANQLYSMKNEFAFSFDICFGGIAASETYYVTLEQDEKDYKITRCSCSNEGEFSSFFALATPEKLAKAKEEILTQIGEYKYEPRFYFSVEDNKLLMQTECIVDIVTPQSLLGQSGCGINHEHVFYTATVCEK